MSSTRPSLEVVRSADTTVLNLRGSFDLTARELVDAACAALCAPADHVVLDLRGVDLLDAHSVRRIRAAVHDAGGEGRHLSVLAPAFFSRLVDPVRVGSPGPAGTTHPDTGPLTEVARRRW